MKSNYRKLGDFIQQVKNKNTDLITDDLRGLSMTKEFRKSTSNIVGTDLRKYKLVYNGQFACDFMSVIRVHKLPVVLHKEDDPVIVSPAYTVFKVRNEELLPEYLMMWFRRDEFDRYADFRCDSSVRGGFKWDEMCEVELPIPPIEEQRAIVAEYKTVTNRIQLNEQINAKLEETAQALYRHWFVDFEFPNEDGKPYKSSGGKMVWNEELEKEVPEGWEQSTIGKLLKKKGYIRGPFGSALKVGDMKSEGIPVYEQQHILDDHRKFRYYISKEKYQKLKRFKVEAKDIVISCSGVNLGKLSMIENDYTIGIINQALLILRIDPQTINPLWIRVFLESKEGKSLLIQESGGSAIPNIAKRELIQAIPLLIPASEVKFKIDGQFSTIYNQKIEIKKQIDFLKLLATLLLSKMAGSKFKEKVSAV